MDAQRALFSAVNQLIAARSVEDLDRGLVEVSPGAAGFERVALLALPTMQQPARVRFVRGTPALDLNDVPDSSPLAAGGVLSGDMAGASGDAEEPHRGVQGSYVLAPLRERERPVALVYADSLRESASPDEAREALLHVLAVAGVVRAGLNLALERDRLLGELDSASRVDPLTALSNRRVFEERLAGELHRSARSRRPFALALFDVDRLDEINRTFGRPAGDEALQHFGAVLRGRARHMDLAARLADDEFAMLLVDVDHQAARSVVERVLDGAREASLSVPARLSVSAGIALNYPVDTAETLMERAQAALADAKRSGRDRTKIM